MHSADKRLPPVHAIKVGGDLTGGVRSYFIRTNATAKRCFSTA